jgi:RNA polymerase sigma-70 factor (ECF subfamily)
MIKIPFLAIIHRCSIKFFWIMFIIVLLKLVDQKKQKKGGGYLMKRKSDQELMQLIHQKNRLALGEIYDRYVNLIYSFALKLTNGDQEATKDIVQQVFLRIWTTTGHYDSEKGQIANWFMTVTRNISIDYIRKERKYKQNMDFQKFQEHQGDACVHDVLQLVTKNLMTREVRWARNQLTETQKRLITLLYWEGYTLKEIAEIENEPIGTIKNRLHQSLKKLHFLLTDGKGGVKDGSQRMR